MMGNGNALNKRVRARFGTAHLVAVVAGLLTAVLLLSFTRSQEALIPVLIASEDIRAGTVISSEHLGVVEVPSGSGVVASLHPASSREGLVGQVAIRSIAQSEPVLRSDTRPIAAQDGRRAMSFPMLASHAVGGDVSVGDEVDVLIVTREGTRFVAESVPVLAVPAPGRLDAVCPKIEGGEPASKKEHMRLFSQAKISMGALIGFLSGYVEAEENSKNVADGKAGIYL